MSVFLSPVGGAGAQFFDNNGNPLTGGKLYTYAAGTTTPQATYTSAAGSVFHTNPIILDAAGRVPSSSEIWLADNQIYKFVLKDSNDVLLATWDQITGVNSNFVNYTAETEVQTATAGQTVFTLTTMTYSPGTGSLTVYVDGVNQYEGTSYLETDGTTVTFTAGLHVGALVKFTTAIQTTGNATDASVVSYSPPFTGSVTTTVEDKLAQIVSVNDFGAVGDGVTDDTNAIQAALTAVDVDGSVMFVPGKSYRITDTITSISRHLVCSGKATIVADLNDANKDAISLSATTVRGGSAQDYIPAPRLEGLLILVKSDLRDGIRLNYGDHPVWDRVDVQRDPVTAPTWRDGVHIEADADQHFIEDLSFRSVRVHDAGRDGFRFEVPSTAWNNIFINVGSYYDREVRGCGLSQAGIPVHFVSSNTAASEKISQHNFFGGEYQTNNTVTNPNPDGFKATKAVGAAAIENINITGLTAECVPTTGTGLGVNTTSMERVTITNFLPYGFTGTSTGVGGTGDYIVFGYLGLDTYTRGGSYTPSAVGGTNGAVATTSSASGFYNGVGKTITAVFQLTVSNWNGATGPIIITLPVTSKSSNAKVAANFWRINNVSLGASYTMVSGYVADGTQYLYLRKNGTGVNDAAVNVADATTPFEIAGSVTYFID